MLAGFAALAFAGLTTASGTPVASRASAGSISARSDAVLGPCRISAGRSSTVQLSEGVPTSSGYAHSTGEIHTLNLMIDFPDAPGEGTAMDRFHEFFPQTTRWFKTASYGRLDYHPEAPIKHWLRMPKPFKAYGINRGSPYEPGYHRLVNDIVATADPQVDFSKYDLINILVTPNAGPSALDTVLSVTFSGNKDAPHADGVPLSNTSFVYSRQDDGSGSYKHTGYRVLPHENGHTFGLPDLYTTRGGGSVGHWDIMSEDWGADNDLLGWHKWKLGWLDDNQVSCASSTGTMERELKPLETPGGRKLIFIPVSHNAGYAVEVRTHAGNDDAVCRPGVLIYHVDASVDTGRGPISVSDSTKHSGGCTRQPNVEAELSDATYKPGQTFTDKGAGITVSVVSKDAGGAYTVRVTRS
ncbi:M6 family metalloprotease domain-containing protein [Streptomyces sp. NRRL F-5126]|uniref:M6 family metalloprotease domain-containing protein n=1 Tax=Streptomyces sp. NRRL F-5126 TaxID=1463857 RepID=UPI001F3724C0|nr:M6 family metalloprotease domain-containing protein [Streptomyces sp. NRRL F-5126]